MDVDSFWGSDAGSGSGSGSGSSSGPGSGSGFGPSSGSGSGPESAPIKLTLPLDLQQVDVWLDTITNKVALNKQINEVVRRVRDLDNDLERQDRRDKELGVFKQKQRLLCNLKFVGFAQRIATCVKIYRFAGVDTSYTIFSERYGRAVRDHQDERRGALDQRIQRVLDPKNPSPMTRILISEGADVERILTTFSETVPHILYGTN